VTATPDMICLSPNHWTGLATSKKHLMRIFAESGRVLFVEPPIDAFSVLGRRRRWAKLRGMREVAPNLSVLSAVTPRTRGLTEWRRRFHAGWRERVRDAADAMGLADPLVWAFAPEHIEYAGALDESLLIYYVTDEPTSLARDREATAACDRAMVERADVVLGLSAKLADARWSPGKTHRLPSAANRRHYSRVLAGDESAGIDAFIDALAAPSAVPPELRELERPLVLFGGAAYDWFHAELLLELSSMRPDWLFALVGPRGRAVRRVSFPDNVVSLGRKPYDAFPRYVARADVTFIPIREGETYDNCDPIIVYEYLLCGKQVVATPFPSAVEHGPLVRTAADASGFAEEIQAALAESRDPDAIRRRVEYGFANTWEDRAARALDIVTAALAERGDREDS
jgi:hypothetical protein